MARPEAQPTQQEIDAVRELPLAQRLVALGYKPGIDFQVQDDLDGLGDFIPEGWGWHPKQWPDDPCPYPEAVMETYGKEVSPREPLHPTQLKLLERRRKSRFD